MSHKLKSTPQLTANPKSSESGYALVALLALMTIMAIAFVAIAPDLKREEQRQRELETIRRGEEIVDAIRAFKAANSTIQLTSLEQLEKGVTPQGRIKTLYVVRSEAMKDLLSKGSKAGEWLVVRRGDKVFADFQRALIKKYGALPPTNDPLWARSAPPPPPLGLENLNKTNDKEDPPPGGDDDTANSGAGEIIGVVSRSQRTSVVTYFGIARHDRWVFTPYYR